MSNEKSAQLEDVVMLALENATPYLQNRDLVKTKIIDTSKQTGDIKQFKILLFESLKNGDIIVKNDVKIYLTYLSKFSAGKR